MNEITRATYVYIKAITIIHVRERKRKISQAIRSPLKLHEKELTQTKQSNVIYVTDYIMVVYFLLRGTSGCRLLPEGLLCGKGKALVGSWFVDVPRAFVFNCSRIRRASMSSSWALRPWLSQASIARCWNSIARA